MSHNCAFASSIIASKAKSRRNITRCRIWDEQLWIVLYVLSDIVGTNVQVITDPRALFKPSRC